MAPVDRLQDNRPTQWPLSLHAEIIYRVLSVLSPVHASDGRVLVCCGVVVPTGSSAATTTPRLGLEVLWTCLHYESGRS